MTLDLKKLAHELRTQDNRATAYPLYQVQQRRIIYGLDMDLHDEAERYWYHPDSDGPIPRAAAVECVVDRMVCDGATVDDAALDIEGYREVGVLFMWEFASAHFTQCAAQRYIDENRHNLSEPRVYVSSQRRCHEWIAVVEHLCIRCAPVYVFIFDEMDYQPDGFDVETFGTKAEANAFEQGVKMFASEVETLCWPFDEDDLVSAVLGVDEAVLMANVQGWLADNSVEVG